MSAWGFICSLVSKLALVLALGVVSGCLSELPPTLGPPESAVEVGPALDSPHVIRVCAKPAGVPRHKYFWAHDGSGRLVLDDWELGLLQRNGQRIYYFDENANLESARMLPIPHNTLQCTEPTRSVLSSTGKFAPAKREPQQAPQTQQAQQAQPAPQTQKTAEQRTVRTAQPPACPNATEPGQARRSRSTTTRTCVRSRTLKAPSRLAPAPAAVAKSEVESPTLAQAVPPPAPTPSPLADWNLPVGLPNQSLPGLDPQRVMECVGSLCHARHPNFAPKGGKPAASGVLEQRSLSTGAGAGGKAPKAKPRKPPAGPKSAATAKPADPKPASVAPYGLKKDGTPKAKPGPKTSDTEPHNAKVIEVRKKSEADGNITIGGGRKPDHPETVVQTPGGHKGSRRIDHTYRTPDGKTRGINVGKTKADGTPVKREQEALEDLNKRGDVPTDFVPYDR